MAAAAFSVRIERTRLREREVNLAGGGSCLRGLWLSRPNHQTGDPVMAQMTVLGRRMIDDMTVRNLSPATQQSYVYAVAKFSRFFGCSPDLLGIEAVRAYQLHLAGLRWSWSHINQVSCALRFFFGMTLGSARSARPHPQRQGAEETAGGAQRRGDRPLPAGGAGAAQPGGSETTAYGAGLRVCEMAALKVGGIDSSRMAIRLEHGKGGKDRPCRPLGSRI